MAFRDLACTSNDDCRFPLHQPAKQLSLFRVAAERAALLWGSDIVREEDVAMAAMLGEILLEHRYKKSVYNGQNYNGNIRNCRNYEMAIENCQDHKANPLNICGHQKFQISNPPWSPGPSTNNDHPLDLDALPMMIRKLRAIYNLT